VVLREGGAEALAVSLGDAAVLEVAGEAAFDLYLYAVGAVPPLTVVLAWVVALEAPACLTGAFMWCPPGA